MFYFREHATETNCETLVSRFKVSSSQGLCALGVVDLSKFICDTFSIAYPAHRRSCAVSGWGRRRGMIWNGEGSGLRHFTKKRFAISRYFIEKASGTTDDIMKFANRLLPQKSHLNRRETGHILSTDPCITKLSWKEKLPDGKKVSVWALKRDKEKIRPPK
jgi:hypothetical protein